MKKLYRFRYKIRQMLYHGCYQFNIRFLMLYFSSYSLYAASSQFDPEVKQNLGDTLVNVSRSVPDLMGFISGLTAITGVFFIMLALFKLKHLADFRNMMSGQQEIGKAAGLLFMGVIFIWMPFILNVITYSIFGQGITALQGKYAVANTSSKYEVAFFVLMQAIGIISFVRGWYILASAAKGQHQQGAFGKALTHIIAGVFLFHLKAFMGLIEETLGLPFIWS